MGLIIDRGADVDHINYNGQTPLYQAAEAGLVDTIEVLIGKRADLKRKYTNNTTVLHHAARCGKLNVVKLLIAKGAEVDAKDSKGVVSKYYAAKEGYFEIMDFLEQCARDVQVSDLNVLGKHSLLRFENEGNDTKKVKVDNYEGSEQVLQNEYFASIGIEGSENYSGLETQTEKLIGEVIL